MADPLRQLADQDPRLDPGQLDDLIARASAQSERLEELRVAAGRQVIDRTRPPAVVRT